MVSPIRPVMPISDKVVEEVRQVADIVEVIGDYVRLKPAGREFKGLCPFHNEKTPSFHVNADESFFYCFGCQKGGDLFTFVQEVEGLGFLETVRQLAERYNITVEETGVDDEQRNEREGILQALRFAAGFYFKQLQTPEGEVCLRYLFDRGLTKETIRQFGLGYAPKRWDGLTSAAEAAGYDPALLAKAGLVREREGGGRYDLFRGRAMFPILSHVGKVVAFGGRVIPGVTESFGDREAPKYINSPEGPVYHKSDVLYGMHQARRALRQAGEAILVEGYTDVIALHQAGVPLAVASSGTALTPGQVRLLGRYAKTVVLLYDADAAGAKATLRGIDHLLAAGLVPYPVTLPDGADPDSFVTKMGADSFHRYLDEHRQDFVAFHVAHARRVGTLDTPEGEAEVAQRIVAAIAQIQDPVMQDGYIIRAGEKLRMPDNNLRPMLRKLLEGQRTAPQASRAPVQANYEPALPAQKPPPAFAEPKPQESALLRLMLEHGAPMVEHVLTRMGLGEFSAGAMRDAVQHLTEQFQTGAVTKSAFLDGTYGPAVQALAASVLTDRHAISTSRKALEVTGQDTPEQDANPYAAATSAMKFLKLIRVDEAIETWKRAAYSAEKSGQDLAPLMSQRMELIALRRRIETGTYFESESP